MSGNGQVPGDGIEWFLSPERIERIDRVVARRYGSLGLVLENIHDSHNQAAVIRTAEAFGLMEANVIETATAKFRPHRKVTRDAHKWIDVRRWSDTEECLASLRQRGMRLYCGALEPEAVSLYELDVVSPCAFIFGNEHEGISELVRKHADAVFSIPMRGFSESLNVSVAAGVVLSHAVRQREIAGMGTDLSENEREALRDRYQRRSVKFLRRLPSASTRGGSAASGAGDGDTGSRRAPRKPEPDRIDPSELFHPNNDERQGDDGAGG